MLTSLKKRKKTHRTGVLGASTFEGSGLAGGVGVRHGPNSPTPNFNALHTHCSWGKYPPNFNAPHGWMDGLVEMCVCICRYILFSLNCGKLASGPISQHCSRGWGLARYHHPVRFPTPPGWGLGAACPSGCCHLPVACNSRGRLWLQAAGPYAGGAPGSVGLGRRVGGPRRGGLECGASSAWRDSSGPRRGLEPMVWVVVLLLECRWHTEDT